MAKGTTEKRRLIKFSNYSMCVTLPKWVIDQLEWRKGDLLTLQTDVKQGRITLFREENQEEAKPRLAKSSDIAIEVADLQQVIEITEDQEPPKLRW